MAHLWRGVLREFADRLNVTDASTVVTLGEGGTPLLPAPSLSRRTGADGDQRVHVGLALLRQRPGLPENAVAAAEQDG